MSSIDPKSVSTAHFHSILLTAVAPRPIALASTIDEEGKVNLSPFSFFNVFSANPPILIFSPARRVRGNTTKHTLDNVLQVPEVAINIVDYPMVEQMSLTSTEYGEGINEFVKAGFTAVASQQIAPPRVKESPVSFECKVIEVKPMGENGGAGNLVICKVVMAHIHKEILNANQQIDTQSLDLVARMGGSWYVRANTQNSFEIPSPLRTHGIGFDQLPQHIKLSKVLSGNHLARLANVEALPSSEDVFKLAKDQKVSAILTDDDYNAQTKRTELHKLAQKILETGDTQKAWCVLLQDSTIV